MSLALLHISNNCRPKAYGMNSCYNKQIVKKKAVAFLILDITVLTIALAALVLNMTGIIPLPKEANWALLGIGASIAISDLTVLASKLLRRYY